MREIDSCVAAGPGARSAEVGQTKAMRQSAGPLVRHELRARPEDLRMITGEGDSTETFLASGDTS